MAPNSTAGPSKAGPSRQSAFQPSKSKIKTIQNTSELLRKSKGKSKAAIGGSFDVAQHVKKLPGAIQVEKFVEARAMEILAFQNAIKSAAAFGNSRVFQSLPRHLRRRAASHNSKRVPKRLRSRAAAEIDPGDNIAKLHRKRAKLRAKGDLRGRSRTEQLLARQRNKTWLPTHIWHAKRFHMINIWGHRLPLTPTLKSFRPAYRASRRKCALSDTSYYGVLELDSDAGLERVTAGRYAGERFETRKADILLYHPDAYPLGLIGPAELIRGDKIWIRVHPSIFDEAFAAIRTAVGVVRDLRGELDSFELVGPMSEEVLSRVLRPIKGDSLNFGQDIENGVYTFTIYDPRLHSPKPFPVNPSPTPSTVSEIWDEETRDSLSTPLFKKSDLDRRRHNLQLPGTALRPLAQDARIPIMLIQRSIGDMHGYTLLLPRGWSQYLLTAFAYAGCLISGLAERRVQHRESGMACFPEHYGAVCKAGAEWEDRKAVEERERWEKKPPGKRPEYGLLGSPWAFKPDWAFLQDDEESAMNDGPAQPWLVQTPILQLLPHLITTDPSSTLAAIINAFRTQRGLPPLTRDLYPSALLQVRLKVLGRGSPKDMAYIYALSAEEREQWLSTEDTQQLGEVKPDLKDLVGFASTGNFSLSKGLGHGLGTVSLKGYVELMLRAQRGSEQDRGRALVKVRNRDGVVCRFAELEVIDSRVV